MTRGETVQILSILRKAYPVFYKDISKREAYENGQAARVIY